MGEHLNNHVPRDHGDDQSSVSVRTELLRAAADGELAPAQAVELERHLAAHPDDQRVIDFERGLRASVAACASEVAPAALRARIVATNSSGTQPASLPFPAINARSNLRFFRSAPWWAAAAAVSLLTGGAFVILRQPGSGPAQGVQIPQPYRTALVTFIGAQHNECEVHADMIGTRLRTTELNRVPREFGQVLGSTPDIGNIDQHGFKLLGAGPCAVPGRGKSVRMVLESTAGDQPRGGRGSLVSIHIQQDTGELNLEAGKTYRLVDKLATPGSAAPEIFVWRRGKFIYFLTSKSEQAMQMARAAFGAEEPSGTI